MIKILSLILKLSFLVCFLTQCQSLSQLEKSRLNHPGMSLSESQTPSAKGNFTGLNAVGTQKGGSCSVCAK